MHNRWIQALLVLLVLLVTGSCDRGPTRPDVSSISITPSASDLSVGDTMNLEASVRDAAGNPLVDQSVFWASSDTSVVTVSAAGMIVTRAAGSAQVAASAQGESGFATIRVVAPAVATVRIEPGSITLDALGDTARLIAVARDGSDSPLDPRQAVWTTSEPGVVAISSSGIATAVRNGVATVTATIDGAAATATVTVAQRVARVAVSPASAALALGDTVRFTAVATDENVYPLASPQGLTWSSSNTAVARIDASGLVTGASTGEAQISASLNGVTGTAVAAVALTPVGAVEVAPAATGVQVDASIDLRATVRDERGNPLGERSVSWTSEDPTIATVDANGRVRGRAQGSATIRAASGGRSGTAVITVTAPPVASVEVVYADGAPGTLRVGGAVQLAAIARDAAGNVVPGTRVLWSSSDRSVAVVDSGGYVRARAVGSVRITATAEGEAGSLSLSVAPPAVATVVVNPDSVSVPVSGKIQLIASPRDAEGNALSNRDASWSSGDPNIARVDRTGNVTAVATGSTLVRATVEGRSGTAQVVVVSPPPVPVSSVSISPSSGEVVVGKTVDFDAQTLDANGNALTDRQIVWTSASPATATVDGSGTARGVAPGQTTITATSEGVSTSVPVTVNPVPVSSVEVTPSAETVAVGKDIQLSAIPRASNGNELAGREVSWSSSDASIARVDEMGIVRGVAPGEATITATSEGQSGSATITVIPRPVASVVVEPSTATFETGNTVQLRAEPRDAENNALTGRLVVWTTSDEGVATVDEDGTVRGIAPGSVTIFATSEGKRGEAGIIVVRPPVASVRITPSSGEVIVGNTVDFDAQALDAAGNILSGREMVWTSASPATATVNENGVVRGEAPGQTTITATSEGVSASVPVTVNPVPVASVEVTPPSGTVMIDGTLQLSATPRASDGSALPGRSIVWSSSDPAIAQVNDQGIVRGVALGTVSIRAELEGKSGVAEVTVTARPVASVTVEPNSARLVRGESIQLEATLRDDRNAVLTGRDVAWSSANSDVASVDDDGTVLALAPGSTTIVATSEGVRGEASVIVDPAPVASVAVSPATGSIRVDQTTQLTATVRDAAGNPLQGRAVSWTSTDGDVATVDENGEVRGVAPGEATITATSEGQSGSGRISVTVPPPAPVVSVRVTPASGEVLVGNTIDFDAEPLDADGNVLSGRQIVWASGNSSVATVDTDGTVRGVAPGEATITATSEGERGTTTITVTTPPPAPVASVEVSPAADTIQIGEATPLDAVVRDANGNVLTDREVTWRSDDSSLASVDGEGNVTGVSSGATSIVATAEGESGSARITIEAAEASGSARLDYVSGDGQQGKNNRTLADPLVVRVMDASGNPVTGVEVKWTTNNTTGRGGVSPSSSRTDENGYTSTTWTLGAGNKNNVRRAWAEMGDSPRVEFTATTDGGDDD